MSGRSSIQSEISKYERWIAQCNKDIADMKDIQTVNKTYEDSFLAEYRTSKTYDLTVSETWKKDLCDVASEYHVFVTAGLKSAKKQTILMYSELQQAIVKAQELIDEYEEAIENLKEILANMDE